MKIKCTNKGTKAIGAGGYSAEFDEKGFATVDKEAGEALVAAYPEMLEVVESKATRKASTKEE